MWDMWADLTYPDCEAICDALEFNRQSHVNNLGADYADVRPHTENNAKANLSKFLAAAHLNKFNKEKPRQKTRKRSVSTPVDDVLSDTAINE